MFFLAIYKYKPLILLYEDLTAMNSSVWVQYKQTQSTRNFKKRQSCSQTCVVTVNIGTSINFRPTNIGRY